MLHQLRKFNLFSQPSAPLWFSGVAQPPSRTDIDWRGQPGWQRGSLAPYCFPSRTYTPQESENRQQTALLSNHKLDTTCSHCCPLEGRSWCTSIHKNSVFPQAITLMTTQTCQTWCRTILLYKHVHIYVFNINLSYLHYYYLHCHLTESHQVASLGSNFKIVKAMSFIVRMQQYLAWLLYQMLQYVSKTYLIFW